VVEPSGKEMSAKPRGRAGCWKWKSLSSQLKSVNARPLAKALSVEITCDGIAKSHVIHVPAKALNAKSASIWSPVCRARDVQLRAEISVSITTFKRLCPAFTASEPPGRASLPKVVFQRFRGCSMCGVRWLIGPTLRRPIWT
jgi:hypothetical protein